MIESALHFSRLRMHCWRHDYFYSTGSAWIVLMAFQDKETRMAVALENITRSGVNSWPKTVTCLFLTVESERRRRQWKIKQIIRHKEVWRGPTWTYYHYHQQQHHHKNQIVHFVWRGKKHRSRIPASNRSARTRSRNSKREREKNQRRTVSNTGLPPTDEKRKASRNEWSIGPSQKI